MSRPSNPDDFAPAGSEVTRQGPARPEVLPPGRRNRPGPPPSPRRGGQAKRTTGGKSPELTQAQALARRMVSESGGTMDTREALAEALAQVRAGAAANPPAAAPAPSAPEPPAATTASRRGRLAPAAPDVPAVDASVLRDQLTSALADLPEEPAEISYDADEAEWAPSEPQVDVGYAAFHEPSTAVSDVVDQDLAEQIALLQDAVMYALRLRLLGEGEAGSWETFDALAENALLASSPDPWQDATPAQVFMYGDRGWLNSPEQPTSAEEILDIIQLGRQEDQ